MKKMLTFPQFFCLIAMVFLLPALALAQEIPSETPAAENKPVDPRYAAFKKMLTGAELTGTFTSGKDAPPAPEKYTIKKVQKMEEGDQWLFFTRIQYGGKDMTLPVPLDVKWADKTPVVTMDQVALPGLGTFDCRVVFHNGKYAGTWSHGKVGGHLFGTFTVPE